MKQEGHGYQIYLHFLAAAAQLNKSSGCDVMLIRD